MTNQTVILPGFLVSGFTTGTSNQQEMSGNSPIGALWQTYMQAEGNLIPAVTDASLTFTADFERYSNDGVQLYIAV